MTASPAEPTRASPGPAPWRALAVGLALVGALTAAFVLAGLVPADAAGFVVLGAGLAVAAGALATWFHARLAREGTDPAAQSVHLQAHLQAARMQAGLGLGFLAKLLGLGLGTAVLCLLGAKFPQVAAFAVAYAVASMVLQLCTAALLARALQRRARLRVIGRQNGPQNGPQKPAATAAPRS